jgi:hypothetical protein
VKKATSNLSDKLHGVNDEVPLSSQVNDNPKIQECPKPQTGRAIFDFVHRAPFVQE